MISDRELARIAGVSHTAIANWRAAGLVPSRPDGKIDRVAGIEAVKGLVAGLEAREADRAELAKARHELTLARRDRERALARLRELELERESGRYVELAAVQADARDTAERVLAILRAIPQRTAASLDGALSAPAERRAAVIERIVADEIERAVGEMSESEYATAREARKETP